MTRKRKEKNYRKKMLENYSYTVTPVIENTEDGPVTRFQFTVFYLNEEVGTSRLFRLECQAVTKAQEFIQDKVQLYDENAITLDVQNLVIDPDTLFRRK